MNITYFKTKKEAMEKMGLSRKVYNRWQPIFEEFMNTENEIMSIDSKTAGYLSAYSACNSIRRSAKRGGFRIKVHACENIVWIEKIKPED